MGGDGLHLCSADGAAGNGLKKPAAPFGAAGPLLCLRGRQFKGVLRVVAEMDNRVGSFSLHRKPQPRHIAVGVGQNQ